MITSTIPKLPGVYKWTNTLNGKVYIGKAVNLLERKRNHRLYDNSYFGRAKKRYGLNAFRFSILEVFPNRNKFIENLIVDREEFWIKIYDSTNAKNGYNLCPRGSVSTKKRWTKESRKAIADSNKKRIWSNETRMKISERQRKENLSEEIRYKMGSSTRGKKIPPETIAKRVAKTKGQKRPTIRVPILQICPKTLSIIKKWESATQAAIELYGNISKRNYIGKCSRGFFKTALGFIWKRERDMCK